MSGIGNFITSFCTSCAVLGVLFILLPKGALTKPVKYIFSLCFVCTLISSAFLLPKPDFSRFEVAQNTEFLTEQNVAATAQATFCEALRLGDINFTKLTVDTNKLSNGSIIISKVTVYTNEEAKKIKDAIGSDSYEVVIVNE